MKPINFPEANKCLGPPEGHEDDIDHLNIWTNKEQCVSLWTSTLRERLSFLLFGKLWVAVLSGDNQPPVAVTITRKLFKTE